MKKYRVLFIILICAIICSCSDIFSQKEYVSVYIINHTPEAVSVYAGLSIIFIPVVSAEIPAGAAGTVLAEKDKTIEVKGQKSKRIFDSRSFSFNGQWDIYYR